MIVLIFHVILHGHVACKLDIEAMLLMHAWLGLCDTWRESERASYLCFPPRETRESDRGKRRGRRNSDMCARLLHCLAITLYF